MKIFCKFPTVNISKLNFWLVICIAKNFIWTTLKMIFSIFRFFCTLRFQIYKYCPIITNHTSMERLFIQIMYKSSKFQMQFNSKYSYTKYISYQHIAGYHWYKYYIWSITCAHNACFLILSLKCVLMSLLMKIVWFFLIISVFKCKI